VTDPSSAQEKHAFVSHVHEDRPHVDTMCKALKAADIPVWVDKTKLGPGEDSRAEIRNAIRSGTMVFLACFLRAWRGAKPLTSTKSFTWP
jgi:hypothetical protein